MAKKFEGFKFNLTLNKGKQPTAAELAAASGQAPSSQMFYQQVVSQQSEAKNRLNNELEDTDAIVIKDKHRKHMNSLSRGGSGLNNPSQMAMK